MMTTIALALTVLATLALSILILAEGGSQVQRSPSWRGLALSMAIVNGLLLVLVAEVLSALGRLEFGWTLATWALLGTIQIPRWRRLIGRLRGSRAPSAPFSRIEIALIVPVLAIVICTGVIALASAPNSWDSLTYHLSRVAHWKQNGSVAFFPTSIERQLSFPPFAEYAILNLQLLTGGDRFAALVQWLSFIGTLVGVSLVAAEFGASRLGQIVAVLFAATLPIAILEASSTQNDLVVSFWVVCFAYFSIAFVSRRSRFDAAAASGALGLALLTKATAYLLVPGFAIGFLIAGLRRHRLRFLPLTLGGLILAAGVPAAFYARNVTTYGEAVGSAHNRASLTHNRIRLASLVSRLLRGAALHASAPPDRLRLPERASALVESIERRMLASESVKPLGAPDWRYTMSREDRAGAPLHFLIALVVLGALGIMARAWRIPALASWHGFGLVVGVIVLAGILRWNVYMVRFHMSLFLLGAPLVGLVASRMKRPRIVVGVSVLLLLASVYPLLWNQLRPVLGPKSVFHVSRREQYVGELNREMRNDMLATIDYLKTRQDAVIGLQLGHESPEYLYWVLLPEVAAGRTRLCHVNVSNGSQRFQSSEECRPTAIVTDMAGIDVLTVNAVQYRRTWQKGALAVYLPGR